MQIGDRVKTQNGTEGTIENMDAQFIYVRDDFDGLVVTKLSCLTPIGDTKMTEQEYETIISEHNAEIKALKEKLCEANKKKHNATSALCLTLCEKYKPYINKKVKITFDKYGNGNTIIRIGFLQCFFESLYGNGIVPLMSKVKKDGTQSLNNYSEWHMESYKCITNIELVE